MTHALIQFAAGIAGVVGIFVFGAVYRATLGYDPPLGEVAIGAIATISVGRTVMSGVSDMQVRKATIQYGRAPLPPGVTPLEGAAP